MKPALHRSVVFWLGVFVLMFLGWLWADSRRTTTSLYKILELEDTRAMPPLTDAMTYTSREASCINGVTLHDGKLVLSYASATKLKPHVTMRRGPLTFMRIAPDYHWQVPALGGGMYYDGANLATVRRYQVVVPMWGVVGLYLMGSGGVLWWRRRKWRRFLLDGGASV
jgi:hypothetical protein